MEYSKVGISTIPMFCVQTTVISAESRYGKSLKADIDIREEILRYYKIINGSDFIGDMTFYCDKAIRIHTNPLFFSLVNAINVSPNFAIGSDPEFRRNAKKFWESVGTPNAFRELKDTVRGIQSALSI